MESIKILNKANHRFQWHRRFSLLPVTTSPAIICRRCCWHWWIAGVMCTGDKLNVANISANFRIRNGPDSLLRGQGETGIWKKLKSKISCQTPIKMTTFWFIYFCICIATGLVVPFRLYSKKGMMRVPIRVFHTLSHSIIKSVLLDFARAKTRSHVQYIWEENFFKVTIAWDFVWGSNETRLDYTL